MGENYDHPRRQIVQMITIIITVSRDRSFRRQDMRGMLIYREIAISFARGQEAGR